MSSVWHAPKSYDFAENSRKRREAELLRKIEEMKAASKSISNAKTAIKKTTTDLVDDAEKSQQNISDIAKKVIDLLPEPSAEQKATRKKNRDDMKGRMFLPVQRPSPNTSELSDTEIGKARILKAGSIAHDTSMLQAQEYLDSDPRTKGWKIDTELSNRDRLVLTNDKEVKISFRGTKWRNPQDALTNTSNALRQDMLAPQNRQGSDVIERIVEKYGVKPSEILGYSKGGNSALIIGDYHEIPATVFNPAIGPNQIRSTSKVPHTVINTVDDPISVGSYLKKKDNWTIKRIRSIQGENPIAQHKLSNFTERGNNQPSGLEKMSIGLISKGQNLAHIETFDAMRSGVESGKTFTETLDDFNASSDGSRQRIDVSNDGGLGERIHAQAPSVRYWIDAGGDFTPREEAHLRMQKVPTKPKLSDEAKSMGISEGDTILPAQKKIMNSSPEARQKFVEQKRTDMKQAVRDLNVKTNILHETMKSNMPTTEGIGTGLISGFAADKIIDAMDPDHKLGQVGDEATKGAVAGGMAAGFLGTAAAPEAAAGAAAWVAGSESGKEITKLTGSAAAGSVGGGAVGGGVAVGTVAAVSAGAEVAGSLAAGSEIGAALGSIVPGAGTAVGLAVGAGVGAAIGGIGFLFGKIHW